MRVRILNIKAERRSSGAGKRAALVEGDPWAANTKAPEGK